MQKKIAKIWKTEAKTKFANAFKAEEKKLYVEK